MNFLKTPDFEHRMTKGERFATWGYFPIHFFVLPILLALWYAFGKVSLTEAEMNLPYYLIGFFFCSVFTRKFLRAEFDALLDNKGTVLISFVSAYVISMALSYIVAFISLIFGDFDNMNQEYMNQIAKSEYNVTFAVSVFLAPFVEETLFRGLIFGSIRRKSRIAAYVVSAILFSLYHVWQYLFFLRDPGVLYAALQYIPASIALAYCYERSGSLWSSVFFHMLNNLASMLIIKYY